MDRIQRAGDPGVAMRAAARAERASIWTALPAYVVSYNATRRTVEAQPTIQGQVLSDQGQWSFQNLPVCPDCPVAFPGGGGFALTFPLQANDEGMLVFSSRAIDSWWQNGGIQNQFELRMHDLSDGFFIPGVFSKARLPLVMPSGSTPRLTSNDGLQYIELAPLGRVNIVAPGGLWVNGVLVTVP